MNEAALSRPDAIIFDWDGTLVDSWRAINEAISATMVAYGHEPWTMEQTKANVRHSMRNAFPKYFGDAWEEAAEHFYAAYAKVHIGYTDAQSGAESLLDWIRAADIYMAVVSNKNGDYLRRESAALDWDRYFGRLVGATDCIEDKPSPVTLTTVLEGTGIEAGPAVWYVGDAGIDIELAENSGCVSIVVGEGDSTYPNPPNRLFENCDDLRRFLDRL